MSDVNSEEKTVLRGVSFVTFNFLKLSNIRLQSIHHRNKVQCADPPLVQHPFPLSIGI